MNNYQAVFCDMDGTLLNDDKKLTEKVIKTVKKVSDKGIPVILVSGRLPGGIYSFREQLGLTTPVIAFGGGLILDENGEVLEYKGFSVEKAKEIEDYAKEIKSTASFNFYDGFKWFTTNPDHPKEIWETGSIGFAPEEAEIEDVLEDDGMVNKCLFIGEPEEIDYLIPLLSERFKELRIVRSGDFLLEVLPKDVMKSEGIKLICDYLKVDPEQILTAGDHYNDLDMIEGPGKAIVMGNSPSDLKELPGIYIAPDNNHDGLAVALEELILKES